jgi:hypothetical protein
MLMKVIIGSVQTRCGSIWMREWVLRILKYGLQAILIIYETPLQVKGKKGKVVPVL